MDEIITSTEAAELRGVDRDTVARWCRAGWLKNVRKAGRYWLVDKAEVLAFEPPKRGPEPEQKGSDESR